MSWKDLLSSPEETVTVPWTGGRIIRAQGRTLKVTGRLPQEHGWHVFTITGGRKATWKEPAEVEPSVVLQGLRTVCGYLVGDRIIPDGASVVPDPQRIIEQTEPVYLLEHGLERFARIRAARYEDGRLIYMEQEFPLGPEFEVTDAFQDRKESVTHIPNVTPALDLAFRFETWQRAEEQRRREELARLAQEEEARRQQEERRQQLAEQLGSAEGRREMARVDFQAGAEAALRVGGAELLDWRDSRVVGEAVVQFRYQGRRFECVCQKANLRIVDAGVCLIDHGSGERGDAYFTLESLPGVIGQAIRERKLVVFRHVDNYDDFDDEDDRW